MIGFDRPVRPEWIYEILKVMQPGEKTGSYNQKFEEITKELIGKEGKRKVRTVIYRSFIYSVQQKNNIVENSFFIQASKEKSLEKMNPIFLVKILMDYEIIRLSVKKIFLLIQNENSFNPWLLKKQMVNTYGDRDVVKRSVNSFLTTLEHFKIIREENGLYIFNGQIWLSEEQLLIFLELYSKYYLKSESMDLDSIEDVFSRIFKIENINQIARKYHGTKWEYIRDHGRNLILVKKNGKGSGNKSV